MDINELMNYCGKSAEKNGWHDDRPKGDGVALRNWQGMKIMLMVSELSEAVEELRKGKAADETYHPTVLGYRLDNEGEYPEHGTHKPEGVPSELADTIIRVLDFCYTEGIDIGSIIDEKLLFNDTRGYRHGGKVA